MTEPALYRLLTYHLPNLMSIFLRVGLFIQRIRPSQMPFVTFHNKLVFCGEELLASRPTTLCWLSATAYSVYSQLASVSGGRLLRTCHAVLTRDKGNMCINMLMAVMVCQSVQPCGTGALLH
jgi:hypothetical protein